MYDKEFKIIVLKMFIELEENKEIDKIRETI